MPAYSVSVRLISDDVVPYELRAIDDIRARHSLRSLLPDGAVIIRVEEIPEPTPEPEVNPPAKKTTRRAAGKARKKSSVSNDPFNADQTFKVTTILGRNGDPEAHRAGCADLKKAQTDSPTDVYVEVTTAKEAAADFYADMIREGSMTELDALGGVAFYPCLNALPSGV